MPSSDYITQNLMPGEQVVAVTRMHPRVLVGPAIVLGVALLLVLIGLIVGRDGVLFIVFGGGVALVGLLLGLALQVERATTECSCTDRRILIKTGFLTTQLREMPLTKVEALRVDQGLLGKIFGFGTLVLTGSGGTRRTCKNIEEPFEFYKHVQVQVALAQKAR